MTVYEVLETIPNFTEMDIYIHEGDFLALASGRWWTPGMTPHFLREVALYSVYVDKKEIEITIKKEEKKEDENNL